MKDMVLGNRYEVLEKIGEGGMAKVYKARCNKLNRFVAVKILRKQFANNEEISQKFKKEATAIANLSDPNIVNILDVGTQDEISYIVMELVNGKTLKEVINFNGNLGYNTTIKIAIQIAKALDCAHKNNIIHRDIKPQNILITENGDVKVTDFGIAKSTDSSTITNTTSIIGSAHYLSPEQAKGTYIDCRADIYSFGVVIYEMVTGKLPFEGESPVTVALKHLQEEPIAPKNLNSAIPDSLNKLILKAMEKEPIKRYQSAKDIIQDLQKIQQNPDVIISDKPILDDQHTIVMSSVNLDATKINKMSKLEEDYYDDGDEFGDEDDDDDEDDDFEDKKVKKSKNGNKVVKKVLISLAGIIIVAMLAFGGFVLAGGAAKEKEVKIPDITGKTIEEATEILKELNLEVQKGDPQKSDKPEGTIIEISPKAGTMVKEKSVVKVIVSAGKEKILMPDLTDEKEADARKTLSDMGITNKITKVEAFSDTKAVGVVIETNPKLRVEIKEDMTITLTVSKGPEKKPVKIPNLYNLSSEEAQKQLTDLKLVPVIEKQKTNDKNFDGKVMDQSEKNKEVEEGHRVTIIVGEYEAKVIDISAYLSSVKTVKDARLILAGANIKCDFDGPSGDADLIVDYPKSIKEGEVVLIKTKPAPVTPPVTPPTPGGNGTNGN